MRSCDGQRTRGIVSFRRAYLGHAGSPPNGIVQADQIVLDGVEQREGPALGDALEQAVDAANRATGVAARGVEEQRLTDHHAGQPCIRGRTGT